MAKWFGTIGFAETVETKPGVWEEQITERKYYGEVIRNTRRLQSTDQLNNDINIANEISIVADPFATNHIYAMRYVEFMGARWTVSSVDASQRPRLTLSVGGVWNGKQT